MAAFRYPVLVLQAHQGMYTAHLVEDVDGEAVSAMGPTRAKAITQLKDHLRWFHKQNPYFQSLEFLDPKLSYQRVTVRPEYSHAGHNYPCTETIQLQGNPTHDLVVPQNVACNLALAYNQIKIVSLSQHIV